MPSPIPLTDLRAFFTDEGTHGQLCDIVILDATPRAWDALFRIIAEHYPHTFEFYPKEGDPVPAALPPADPVAVVAAGSCNDGPRPSLWFDLAGLNVRVHFFSTEWIELDTPRIQITPERYSAVAEFMQRLGDASGRDVYITNESEPNAAAMVYEPARGGFRRPRHGEGSDGTVAARLRAALAAALRPVLDAASSRPGRERERAGFIPIETLRTALAAVEHLSAEHPEIILQDELTLDQRYEIDRAWSTLAAIVTPPPGSSAQLYRAEYERDLIDQAHRLIRKKPPPDDDPWRLPRRLP